MGCPLGHLRAPHRNLKCFSYPTGPVWGPWVTHKVAVRRPYGHVRELTQPELPKIPHGCRIWPYGARAFPLRSPHVLFTGCLPPGNPYGARKLIMHALKLYGPHTGRQNSYDAAWGPCGPRGWTYDFCSKQPGKSPYGARECDVTEALPTLPLLSKTSRRCLQNISHFSWISIVNTFSLSISNLRTKAFFNMSGTIKSFALSENGPLSGDSTSKEGNRSKNLVAVSI